MHIGSAICWLAFGMGIVILIFAFQKGKIWLMLLCFVWLIYLLILASDPFISSFNMNYPLIPKDKKESIEQDLFIVNYDATWDDKSSLRKPLPNLKAWLERNKKRYPHYYFWFSDNFCGGKITPSVFV